METLTLQPQTLIILAELIKCWNQDPASQNNSLIITTDQVAITDGKDILLLYNFLQKMKTRTRAMLQK